MTRRALTLAEGLIHARERVSLDSAEPKTPVLGSVGRAGNITMTTNIENPSTVYSGVAYWVSCLADGYYYGRSCDETSYEMPGYCSCDGLRGFSAAPSALHDLYSGACSTEEIVIAKNGSYIDLRTAGKYTGIMREVVQLYAGRAQAVPWDYRWSNSHGIAETSDGTRWVVHISANGVTCQELEETEETSCGLASVRRPIGVTGDVYTIATAQDLAAFYSKTAWFDACGWAFSYPDGMEIRNTARGVSANGLATSVLCTISITETGTLPPLSAAVSLGLETEIYAVVNIDGMPNRGTWYVPDETDLGLQTITVPDYSALGLPIANANPVLYTYHDGAQWQEVRWRSLDTLQTMPSDTFPQKNPFCTVLPAKASEIGTYVRYVSGLNQPTWGPEIPSKGHQVMSVTFADRIEETTKATPLGGYGYFNLTTDSVLVLDGVAHSCEYHEYTEYGGLEIWYYEVVSPIGDREALTYLWRRLVTGQDTAGTHQYATTYFADARMTTGEVTVAEYGAGCEDENYIAKFEPETRPWTSVALGNGEWTTVDPRDATVWRRTGGTYETYIAGANMHGQQCVEYPLTLVPDEYTCAKTSEIQPASFRYVAVELGWMASGGHDHILFSDTVFTPEDLYPDPIPAALYRDCVGQGGYVMKIATWGIESDGVFGDAIAAQRPNEAEFNTRWAFVGVPVTPV